MCKHLRSSGIDSEESILSGWKSIPGILKSFANTGSGLVKFPVLSSVYMFWGVIVTTCFRTSCFSVLFFSFVTEPKSRVPKRTRDWYRLRRIYTSHFRGWQNCVETWLYSVHWYRYTRTIHPLCHTSRRFIVIPNTTEYREWQRPFSGVHSITMEKLAQAGDGSVHAHPHFHYICHHIQSCVYAPAKRADTLLSLISTLFLYVLCAQHSPLPSTGVAT
jgi:hypothetical protein